MSHAPSKPGFRSVPEPPASASRRPRTPRARVALLALAALTCPACFGCAAGTRANGPRDTLLSYAAALREGRASDAYALLSREAQAQLSLADFTRMVNENSSEINEISARLSRPSEPPRVTATLTSSEGETLLMVYEDGRWHVDGSALDLYAQDTPEASLASFVRAYENERYDVLMRFVPDEERAGLSAEQLREAWEGEQRAQMERLTQALRASLSSMRVERIGTRATVGYGAGATVELIFERGIWKIEDF